MKGFKKLLIGKCLALSLISTGYAAMPQPFGWYVEGNLGKSWVSNKSYGNAGVKNTGLGGSAALGYKFTHYFAGEVGYTYYATSRIINSFGTTVGNDKHWSADLAGKVILPVYKTGLEVFAKAGIGMIYSYETLTNASAAALNNITLDTGSHATTMLYVGGGVDYAVTKNLIANVQWMRQRGRRLTGDGELASAGLAWIF